LVADLRAKDKPNASGLDKFESANLDTMLEQSGKMAALPVPLPNAAMAIWFAKLCDLVTGDVSEEVQAEIDRQIQELFNPEEPELDEETLTHLAEALGVDVLDIAKMLEGGQDG
jgi:hypothetical protein